MEIYFPQLKFKASVHFYMFHLCGCVQMRKETWMSMTVACSTTDC